jgi:16S rRNA (guanine966-N2)-methyltransferase
MRIISGKHKGKSISFAKSKNTRPLKDSVKENIFNILLHSPIIDIKIEEANVLDLYSGIGSFGLECLSRGAKKITFVEKDKDTIKILYENILKLSAEKKTTVVEGETSKFVSEEQSQKFEIFFFDPPFTENNYIEVLKLILKNLIFKENHIVIIHREKGCFDNFDGLILPLITKEYGRSKIIFGKFLA